MKPRVVDRRDVSRIKPPGAEPLQGLARRHQSRACLLAWAARMLGLSNSRMWARCTNRATAAIVVSGSLKI